MRLSQRFMIVVVVQLPSCVQLFATPMTAALQASLSFSISWSLLRFMSIKLVMLSYHLILCCTLLFLPSVFPSIRVFSNESALPIRWPKYWSFSFTICPSSEYSGLISFRIDWFALFTVQETLKVILQPCNLKASIPLQSAFFMVQFLHPYITTGKTRDLIIWWSFVSKVMFLLRNKLCLLWLSFQGASIFLVSCLESAVILEPKKRKSVTASTFSTSICHEVMGTKCHDLSFFEC